MMWPGWGTYEPREGARQKRGPPACCPQHVAPGQSRDDRGEERHLLDVRVTQVVGVRVPHHALSRPADAVVRGVDEIVLPRKRWHRATHARERLE
eukprot:scaffold265340_cov30-Tisochrysis_lutea.AAC.7